jgi:hypothetical protein
VAAVSCDLAWPSQVSIQEQLLHSDEKQFHGGRVFKARRPCITQLWAESNKEEGKKSRFLVDSSLISKHEYFGSGVGWQDRELGAEK